MNPGRLFAIVTAGVSASGVIACGHENPPPSTEGPAASAPSNDANRALTEQECQSLGEWLADACHSQSHGRSERIDGWCGDLTRGVQDGSWVTHDCVDHIHYMDSECMRSAASIGHMMDCEQSGQ
jgi:hypothetical protein